MADRGDRRRPGRRSDRGFNRVTHGRPCPRRRNLLSPFVVRSPRRGVYAIIVDNCVYLHLGLGRSRAPRSHHGRDATRSGFSGPPLARPAAAGCAAAGGWPRVDLKVDLGASVERWNPELRTRCARACGPGPKPVRRERNKGEASWRGAPRAQVHLHAYTDRSTEPRRRQVLIGLLLLRLETLTRDPRTALAVATLSISTGGRASR